VRPRTVFLAGTPSAILEPAGAGTRRSVTTRDPFGVIRTKDIFDVLTRLIAGILARSMEYWQSGPECGAVFGIIGRDIDARSHASDKELASGDARIADERWCKDVSFAQADSAQSASP